MSRASKRLREIIRHSVAAVAVIGLLAPQATVGVSAQDALPSIAEAAPASTPTGAATAPTNQAPPSAAASASPAATKPTRKGFSADEREAPRAEATLIIVNARALTATSVVVVTGGKVVARSGPLVSNARFSLKLPRSK